MRGLIGYAGRTGPYLYLETPEGHDGQALSWTRDHGRTPGRLIPLPMGGRTPHHALGLGQGRGRVDDRTPDPRLFSAFELAAAGKREMTDGLGRSCRATACFRAHPRLENRGAHGWSRCCIAALRSR